MTGVQTCALPISKTGSNFDDFTVAIISVKKAKAGKIEEAIEIYRWFLPILELDINTKMVQNIKLAEVATKIGTENVREPRLPLIGTEREHVLAIIENGMKTRPNLPDYKQYLGRS